MSRLRSGRRFVGIACVGADVLSEGADRVLAGVVGRANATAVSLGLTVAEPAPEGEGSFSPPTDGGTSVRRFDRPLWGARALWMRSAPAFRPNPCHYANGRYVPEPATDLTRRGGPVTREFLRAARDAGLKTYLQFSACTPPGLRADDVPRLPDGGIPDRMVRTGSLAAPDVRTFAVARTRDVLDAYPGLTGIRLDYAEAPCYKLPEAFVDFSPHARNWAARRGFDMAAIVEGIGRLYAFLNGSLTNDHLAAVGSAADLRAALASVLNDPDVTEAVNRWLEVKAALSADLIAHYRTAVTAHAGPDVEVSVNAFAPPFTQLTGFDPNAAAPSSSSMVPKLYTMHWSQMVDFWAGHLLACNADLDATLVTRAIARLFDLADDVQAVTLADFGYPEPDEPHPIADEPQRRKIDEVVRAAAGRAAVYPLVHGYGPLEDFRRRLRLVADSGADGVWINRYGYLSDDKLDTIAEIWH